MNECENCGHEVDFHRPHKLGGHVCRLRTSEDGQICGCNQAECRK